ncbi:alpha-tubulin N-acetyltransferase 1 [Sarcoptes scabiei]|nr:alpha-tubulin N-acetyltransferase 1 [Sarcoptes scabiei]
MAYLSFDYLSSLICCHPRFDLNQTFCSNLLHNRKKHDDCFDDDDNDGDEESGHDICYLANELPLNKTVSRIDAVTSPKNDCCDTDSRLIYDSGSSTVAPYYYGDIINFHYLDHHRQHREQFLQNHHNYRRHRNHSLRTKRSIMDGLRVQLKNQVSRHSSHNQYLRSPLVNRSDDFKVSLRGWLYRLEGAALKQWKRRWCVLADYCLFYYKDMGEEKMLGSLLLPSYKISPCFIRDGISRKFAFKAEHNNMKTYYFSADSKEIQQQWMNAMSMASIMQLNAIFQAVNVASNDTTIIKSLSNIKNKSQRNDSDQSNEKDSLVGTESSCLDDESGFKAYQQSKRFEENNNSFISMPFIQSTNQYDTNHLHSYDLYNSVGLPLHYQHSNYYGGMEQGPPKPQRQYLNDMMRSMNLYHHSHQQNDFRPSHNLVANYVNHNYFISGDQNYVPYDNQTRDYFGEVKNQYDDINLSIQQSQQQQYNNIIQSQYSDPQKEIQSRLERLHPRPRSADFLERNQDYEIDAECSEIFLTKSNHLNEAAATALSNQQIIVPMRPKSSIEKFNKEFFNDGLLIENGTNYGEIKMNRLMRNTSKIQSVENHHLAHQHHQQQQQQSSIVPSNNNNLSTNYGYNLYNEENKINDSYRRVRENFHNDYYDENRFARSNNLNGSIPQRPPLPKEFVGNGFPITITSTSIKDLNGSNRMNPIVNNSFNNASEFCRVDPLDFDGAIVDRIDHDHSDQTTQSISDPFELSKEEYYRASKLFYERKNCAQMVSLSSELLPSLINQNESLRKNELNEIGLPFLPVMKLSKNSIQNFNNNFQNKGTTKEKIDDDNNDHNCSKRFENKIPILLQKSSILVDKNLGDNNANDDDCLETDQNQSNEELEIKFKIGLNVRTYRKPKSLQNDIDQNDFESGEDSPQSKITNHNEISPLIPDPKQSLKDSNNCKEELRPVTNIENRISFDEQDKSKSSSTTLSSLSSSTSIGSSTQAPYYYSDLLNEEQKIALQKKLGNFATPPPLLSRCSATKNARFIGTKSLNLIKNLDTTVIKTDDCSSEDSGGDGNHHADQSGKIVKVSQSECFSFDQKENKIRRILHNKDNERNDERKEVRPISKIKEIISTEQPIYENFETPKPTPASTSSTSSLSSKSSHHHLHMNNDSRKQLTVAKIPFISSNDSHKFGRKHPMKQLNHHPQQQDDRLKTSSNLSSSINHPNKIDESNNSNNNFNDNQSNDEDGVALNRNRIVNETLTLASIVGNDDDHLDSMPVKFSFKSNITKRTKRIKRRSKENVNDNASDSEIATNLGSKWFDREKKTSLLKASRRFSISASDFVGKNQEELILLLIQLRRKQSRLIKTCEQLRLEMDSEEKMMELEPYRQIDYQMRYNELSKRWKEKRQELKMQTPIIQTIDHLIKLKSKSKLSELNKKKAASTSFLDKVLDYNSDNRHPSNNDGEDGDDDDDSLQQLLQRKKLDQSLFDGEDSRIRSDRNQDETVDRKNSDNFDQDSSNKNVEIFKQQQKILEGELDRVRGMLTHSTKKLEEKAVENARMEKEMLMARNKLKQVLENEQEAMEITRSSKLELELAHINRVIDDLHSRRKQLNTAIENLKKQSSTESNNGTTDRNDQGSLINSSDPKTLDDDEANKLNEKSETSLYPLYENIKKSQRSSNSKTNRKSSKKFNDNNLWNDRTNNNLNDEFFTLNINLDRHAEFLRSSKNLIDTDFEINNNNSNHQNHQYNRSMCEFDPNKSFALIGEYPNGSIVDQQIQQIYNYQPLIKSSSNEVKTVREVKRESERRKFQQIRTNVYNHHHFDPNGIVDSQQHHTQQNFSGKTYDRFDNSLKLPIKTKVGDLNRIQ